jgi:uncharacterized membrane protein YidH (DUF202 family)
MMQPRDPGLQPERTALAWRRTALAMTVNAILVMRTGIASQARPLMAGGALLAAFALVLTGASVLRHRQLASGAPAAPGQGLLALTTVAVLAAAVCAVASMVR